jgi:hypothetical protein
MHKAVRGPVISEMLQYKTVHRQSDIVNASLALSKDFIKSYPSGNADIVRAHIPSYRQRCEKIAFLLHESMQPRPFVSQDKCNRDREIDIPDRPAGFGGEADHPEPPLLDKFEELG